MFKGKYKSLVTIKILLLTYAEVLQGAENKKPQSLNATAHPDFLQTTASLPKPPSDGDFCCTK